jgi:hypothetical protein
LVLHNHNKCIGHNKCCVFAVQVQLVDSPGFHMLLLPFRDDTRAPEVEQAMLKRLGGAPPRANEEQVGTMLMCD